MVPLLIFSGQAKAWLSFSSLSAGTMLELVLYGIPISLHFLFYN